jgi:5-methylthioadenosine/S-adenosylhomocysteine deaminase
LSTTLIRSRSTITHASRHQPPAIIADGAVLQEDGVIAAIGTFDDLHRRYPDTPVLGNGKS